MVKTLKKVAKELNKASRLHKRQSKIVKNYIKKTERPSARSTRKKGQLMSQSKKKKEGNERTKRTCW